MSVFHELDVAFVHVVIKGGLTALEYTAGFRYFDVVSTWFCWELCDGVCNCRGYYRGKHFAQNLREDRFDFHNEFCLFVSERKVEVVILSLKLLVWQLRGVIYCVQ